MLEWVLIFTVIICLVFISAYRFKKSRMPDNKASLVQKISVALPLILSALVLSSFAIGSFKVTTPSMLSALEVGDLVFINKLKYRISAPLSQKTIMTTGSPKRGDVIVFRWSKDKPTPQIKRVIGLPGDTVELLNKQLHLNSVEVPTRYYGEHEIPNDNTEYLIFNEDIPKSDGGQITYSSMILEYERYLETSGNASWLVPEGHFFVLGDNRDNSIDSRTHGFVSENNIIGQANFVWFHSNSNNGLKGIKLSRVGKPVTYSLPETSSE